MYRMGGKVIVTCSRLSFDLLSIPKQRDGDLVLGDLDTNAQP